MPHLIAFQRKNGTTSTSALAKSLLSGPFHIFHGLSRHWGSECGLVDSQRRALRGRCGSNLSPRPFSWV